MAIYVTSDTHGHLAALDRALELAAPGADDTVCVLGDMIDRGPDPLGVMRLVRGLTGAIVLPGNHERMMLDAILGEDDENAALWALNGGMVTMSQIEGLTKGEYCELIDWVATRPLFEVVEAAGRAYILVHAGIDALAARGYLATDGVDTDGRRGAGAATVGQLRAMLETQDPQDLLWIREGFWGCPTGLVGTDGTGPVVVAGHTPSISLAIYADRTDIDDSDPDQELRRVIRAGACEDTGGVADRIDIDCSAAAGPGRGRMGVMRLDDGAAWYAEIAEDE